ncbi:hypothetical protein PCC7424_0283 [Gloeothece citriformis PCC 7424]|uniref:Uncharacterized protein n=1 Tax=Gloeothece citriformis (strain PCC 7424) TaxID=65393 RepID=B7KAS9_GLOC7|nr:hypothetical protein [Gloeothece citriformis]ACK68751.1 hypothetical protein PCC7424_0283 [Gloeothece citriformis PCC 7424]
MIVIQTDPNRKTNANLQDLVRQANFNRVPTIRLQNYRVSA